LSNAHQQIFQLHLLFMQELQAAKTPLGDVKYYALEKLFKDMTQLASELADEAVVAERLLERIGPSTTRKGS
jgi:hypothetical protein